MTEPSIAGEDPYQDSLVSIGNREIERKIHGTGEISKQKFDQYARVTEMSKQQINSLDGGDSLDLQVSLTEILQNDNLRRSSPESSIIDKTNLFGIKMID